MKTNSYLTFKTKNNDWRINSLFDTPVFYFIGKCSKFYKSK
jgi:hypothetical protein